MRSKTIEPGISLMLAAPSFHVSSHNAIAFLLMTSWVLAAPVSAVSQTLENPPREGVVADVPSLDDLVSFANGQSDLRVALERYAEDRAALHRRYDVEFSPTLRARLRLFYAGWQDRLDDFDFDDLNHEGQADYIMLSNRLVFELEMLQFRRQVCKMKGRGYVEGALVAEAELMATIVDR